MHNFMKANMLGLLLGVVFATTGTSAIAVGFSDSTGKTVCPGDITVTAAGTVACASGATSTQLCATDQALAIDSFGVISCLVSKAPVCKLDVQKSTFTPNAITLSTTCTPAADSYIWTNTGFGSKAAGGDLPAPATTTAYAVAGVNAAGTGATATATWTVSAALPTCSLVASPNPTTPGGSVTLSATCNPAASSYVWSTNAGFATSSASGVVAPTTTTTYTVTGKNATGASGNTASVTVAVSAPATSPPVCTLEQGASFVPNSISLAATCNPAATAYAWSVNTGYGVTSGNSINIATPTVTTTYTVTGSNSAGPGNLASVVVSVAAPVPPVCSVSASPTTVVAGNTVTLTTLCSPAATSFDWTDSTPATGLAVNASNPAVLTIPLATVPGVYTYGVVGKNAIGADQKRTVNVTVTEPPKTCTLTATPATVGAGEAVTLSASCVPAATSYTWSSTGTAPTFTSASGTVNPSATTTYTVIGKDSAGATISTASAQVVVAAPNCALTVSPASMSTAGGSATLTASCLPVPATYTWTALTAGGTLDSTTTSPTATVTLPNGVATGTYSYSVQGTNGSGPGNTATASVGVQASYCGTSANQLSGAILKNTNTPIDLNSQGGLNFRWNINRGESRSVEFTTGAAGRSGNFGNDIDPIGQNVDEFMNISTSQCDFKYENIYGNRCAASGSTNGLRYIVQAAGSTPPDGYCSLLPNTTYWVNIRNETAIDPSARGKDSCPAGVTCGFVFQFH